MSAKRIKELEQEIKLTKELIELQEKLNMLKSYQPISYYQPVYVPTVWEPSPNRPSWIKTNTSGNDIVWSNLGDSCNQQ